MAPVPLQDVVAHWNKLFENFETSPNDFYASLEKLLFARRIPGLAVSRVTWSENGILSPDREYLRVTGDQHCYDICAAPFGTGFFFSSWLTRPKARLVPLWGLGFVFGMLALDRILATLWKPIPDQLFNLWAGHFILSAFIGFIGSPYLLVPLSSLLLLWIVALLARANHPGPERAMLAIPLVGALYAQLFAPQTYYRIDTMLMFQSAVHAALMEVIDGQMTTKGLRALSDEECRPVFHELLFTGGASQRSERLASSQPPRGVPPAEPEVDASEELPDGRILLAMSQNRTSPEATA